MAAASKYSDFVMPHTSIAMVRRLNRAGSNASEACCSTERPATICNQADTRFLQAGSRVDECREIAHAARPASSAHG